jgi:hypothetical protein
MKIEFTPGRYKLLKGITLLIAVVLMAYVAYAATQLTVSNTGTVTLTKNMQGITFAPPNSQPTCSSASPYSDTPSPIAWGNIPQGGSANGYICVKNVGGTGLTYTVSTTTSPPTGITVTYNGTATLTTASALASGQTSLINVVVSAALTAVPAGFSYTSTIN